jgi:hypothetical protein
MHATRANFLVHVCGFAFDRIGDFDFSWRIVPREAGYGAFSPIDGGDVGSPEAATGIYAGTGER